MKLFSYLYQLFFLENLYEKRATAYQARTEATIQVRLLYIRKV